MSERRTDGGTAERSMESPAGGSTWLGRLWLKVANRYERYLNLDKDDREIIDIHGWGTIISHWLLLVFLLLTTLTGLSKWLGQYGPLNIGIWGGYNPAFLIHVWTGMLLAVIAFVLFPYYAFVVDDKDWIPTAEQVEEQIIIALAFVGLASYIPGYKNARRSIDAETGEWGAHHPTQTAFWYAVWLFVGVLTLTGIALWAELSSDPAGWVVALGFMQNWFGFEALLRIHLVSTVIIVASVVVHAYFPLMPSNHDLLNLMINGNLKGWLIDDETKPETKGSVRTKDSMFGALKGVASLLGTGPDVQDTVSGTSAEDEPEIETGHTGGNAEGDEETNS